MTRTGLSSIPQLITANDMLKLCRYAMKNDTFRKIVSTREGQNTRFQQAERGILFPQQQQRA